MKSTTTVDGNDLIITRHIAAPTERIWDALTDAEKLKQWFVPPPWAFSELVIEPVPGGRFMTDMHGPGPDGAEASHRSEGCVLEVVPNRRIAWTDALSAGWRPNEAPFLTAIITLEPAEGGTTYTARALHRDEATRKQHEDMGFAEGWGTCIEQLAGMVEG